MARKIGAVNQTDSERVNVGCLDGIDDQEAVNVITQHFASVSQEYEPLKIENLPCYLPAQQPPQVDESTVYSRLRKIKTSWG